MEKNDKNKQKTLYLMKAAAVTKRKVKKWKRMGGMNQIIYFGSNSRIKYMLVWG